MTSREHALECELWLRTAHYRLEQGDLAATEAALSRAADHAHSAATVRAQEVSR